MSQLGYTWYPQDWWTSETFKRLKRFPMVRYAIRELFDLMYKEGSPISMSREYLVDDFNIELTDVEYSKLMEFVTITDDGKWWISSVKKRLTKAEVARVNGNKGGAPKGNKNAKKTTQEPTETTNGNNPNNPPLESKRESKREIKDDDKSSLKNNQPTSSFFIPISRAVEILDFTNEGFALIAKRRTQKSVEALAAMVSGFIEAQKGYGQKSWPNEQDLKKHFISWVKKQQETKPLNGLKNGEKPMGAVDHE